MSVQNRPSYPHENISSLRALAAHLRIELDELLYVASNVEKFYRPGPPQEKKYGGIRETHDAAPRLKRIHEHIKNRLLKEVEFPGYVQGGVAVSGPPRSYITNAQMHAGKKVLIAEDIASFYPSTSRRIVYLVWLSFFRFTPEVAELLTKLTTLNSQLLQGWKTSGYIANLAFFKIEPMLVEKLRAQGLTYTRYIDDITISSNRALSRAEKSRVISSVYGMLMRLDYDPKRVKQEILTKGRQSMKVMNLSTSSSKASLTKTERRQIRAIVHNLEQRFKHEKKSRSYFTAWRSASGKVARLTILHPKPGYRLRAKLEAIKPT